MQLSEPIVHTHTSISVRDGTYLVLESLDRFRVYPDSGFIFLAVKAETEEFSPFRPVYRTFSLIYLE